MFKKFFSLFKSNKKQNSSDWLARPETIVSPKLRIPKERSTIDPERAELYKAFNREKNKLRLRKNDLEMIATEMANTMGQSRIYYDRRDKIYEWLKMNIRNDLSKMSNNEIRELITEMVEYNENTKSHQERIHTLIRSKVEYLIISEQRGLSEQQVAEMIENIVWWIMNLLKSSKPTAYDMFNEIYDDLKVTMVQDGKGFYKN